MRSRVSELRAANHHDFHVVLKARLNDAQSIPWFIAATLPSKCAESVFCCQAVALHLKCKAIRAKFMGRAFGGLKRMVNPNTVALM